MPAASSTEKITNERGDYPAVIGHAQRDRHLARFCGS
jgi:hypothetical protein